MGWYNTDWLYKKQATIANPSANHPMKITVGYALTGDVGLNSRCKVDFGDVRFVNSTETATLPYWTETISASSEAVFWVKTDGASTIYIYYSNIAAVTESNGETTFPFFDDFPGSALDGSKWTTVSGTVPVVAGSCLELTTTVGSRATLEQNSVNYALFTRPSYVRTLVRTADTTESTYAHVCGFRKPGTYDDTEAHMVYNNAWGWNSRSRKAAVAWSVYHLGQDPYNVWQKRGVEWRDTAVTFFRDDVAYTTCTATANISDQSLAVYFCEGTTGPTWYVDWVFAFPLAATNPTWSTFGNEESQSTTQIFTGGYYDALSSSTEYNFLMGGLAWGALSNHQTLIPYDITIKSLKVTLTVAPGAGTSRTFKIMKNGVATALSLTISDTDTSGTTSTNVTFSAGDAVTLESSATGSPAIAYAKWYGIMSATGNECAIMGSCEYAVTGPTEYLPVCGTGTPSSSSATFGIPVPVSGAFKDLHVKITQYPGSGTYWDFTILNNTTATALTCRISDLGTVGLDTTHTTTFAAGDKVMLKITSSGWPYSIPITRWGLGFAPDDTGTGVLMGNTKTDLLTTSTPEYHLITNGYVFVAASTVEANMQQGVPECLISDFWVSHYTAPGAGKSYTWTVRKNSAATSLGVTLSGTDTTTHNSDYTLTVAADGLITLQSVATSVPATGDSYWSCITKYTGRIIHQGSASDTFALSDTISSVVTRVPTLKIGWVMAE